MEDGVLADTGTIIPSQREIHERDVVADPRLERDVAFFLRWGYVIVDDALSMEQVESLRAALDESYLRQKSQFIGELLEEDDRFSFLLDNPPVFDRIRALLGSCVQLHSATGRVTESGTPDQNWHRDNPWPMEPSRTPSGSLPPGHINCGYYLDEITMDNGPIVVVPGSSRAPFRPPVGTVQMPDEKYVLAKPGQAVMFDGWTWHRGAENKSSEWRRVCLMCYQNAWMKSREPFDGPRVTRLREEGSDERKLLLGGIRSW